MDLTSSPQDNDEEEGHKDQMNLGFESADIGEVEVYVISTEDNFQVMFRK